MSKCEKNASGEHEMDFERMEYKHYIGTHTAVFAVECLDCKAVGELTVDALDADWPDAEEESESA